MIHDVDESLEALVRREALNGSRVEIAFDAPTKDWVARRNAPTVDLYLYDIREDLQRREVAWEPVRDDTGRVTEHRPPARRFKLSYLVTAWTQRPEDEHRLLAGLLTCFLRNETVPDDLLDGDLADQPLPVYLQVAQPAGPDRSIADVWTALGGELKPSLDLVVIAPFDARRVTQAAPAVLEVLRLGMAGEDGAIEPGRAGRGAGRRLMRGERGRGGGPLSPAEPALQEETVDIGGPEQPGRRIQIRGISRP